MAPKDKVEQGLDITYSGTSSKVESVDRQLVREGNNSTLGGLPTDTPSAAQNPGADQLLVSLSLSFVYII
jgi:hypothetical protein